MAKRRKQRASQQRPSSPKLESKKAQPKKQTETHGTTTTAVATPSAQTAPAVTTTSESHKSSHPGSPRPTQTQKMLQVAATIERDFTDVEEDFFRAGMVEHAPSAADSFDDLDESPARRPGLWSRLVGRLSGRAAA